jgi:uncharacterized membrane protein YoaK (UPF0700 family)
MRSPFEITEEAILAPRNVLGWTLFSLAAGSVNAAAFMACRSFVTHMTGTVTSLGLDATNPRLATEYGLVFGAFVAGAMLAVLMVETLPAHRRELMAIPFLIVFAVLLATALAGQAGAFGPFGAANTETTGAFALLVLLAAAMGIQNAAVAATTNNGVRTTHLTGPATDLAASLVRAALGRGLGTAREARWALVRAVKIAAFAIGAALSAKYAAQLEYHVFAVPAALVILALGFTFAPADTSPVTEDDSDDADESGVHRQESPTKTDKAA